MPSGMKPSTSAPFLLGFWLAGNLAIFGVVSSTFYGIPVALEVNQKLAERAGFDPDDEAARKSSPIWVFSSELNRLFFHHWNRIQLAIGVLTLIVLLARCRCPGALTCAVLALAAVGVLAFYLEPRLVELGRSLDFVPREPESESLKKFHLLHKIYTAIALIEVALIAVASLCVWITNHKRLNAGA